jgi:hypothetical protein
MTGRREDESDLPIRAAQARRVELGAAQAADRPREQHDLLGGHGRGQGGRYQLDHATGEMKTAFGIDDSTNALQPLLGPKDKRVLLM